MPARSIEPTRTAAIAPRSDDRDVIVSRVIHAPRALVYHAFTTREHVVKWWHPKVFTWVDCDDFDARVGGRFGFTMHAPDGSVYVSRCVFLELSESDRLVYDEECFENRKLFHRARQTVLFEDQGGRTLVTIRARLDWVAGRDARWTPAYMREGWQSGWQDNLDALTAYLAPQGGLARGCA